MELIESFGSILSTLGLVVFLFLFARILSATYRSAVFKLENEVKIRQFKKKKKIN